VLGDLMSCDDSEIEIIVHCIIAVLLHSTVCVYTRLSGDS